MTFKTILLASALIAAPAAQVSDLEPACVGASPTGRRPRYAASSRRSPSFSTSASSGRIGSGRAHEDIDVVRPARSAEAGRRDAAHQRVLEPGARRPDEFCGLDGRDVAVRVVDRIARVTSRKDYESHYQQGEKVPAWKLLHDVGSMWVR